MRLSTSAYELLKNHGEKFHTFVKDKRTDLPVEFKGTLENTNIVVIGAGDLYEGYLNLCEKLHFLLGKNSRLSIYDPKFFCTQIKSDVSSGDVYIRSFDEIQKDSIALILSPNKFHVEQLCELTDNRNIKGIYCEKPMAINKSDLRILDNLINKTQKPVYFGDFFYYKALGLLSLTGIPMPYKNLLHIEYDETNGLIADAVNNSVSVLGKIIRTEGRLVKSGHPSLLNRRWIDNKAEGGGVLLDLFVHLLNLTNLMGLNIDTIERTEIKKYLHAGLIDAPKGLFRELQSHEVEDYAHVVGKMQNGAEFDFKCAQHEIKKANYLLLEDENHNKLKVSLSRTDRSVEYRDKSDKILARINLNVSPYLIMMHHALNYLSLSENTAPFFYKEQHESIMQIENIKKLASKI